MCVWWREQPGLPGTLQWRASERTVNTSTWYLWVNVDSRQTESFTEQPATVNILQSPVVTSIQFVKSALSSRRYESSWTLDWTARREFSPFCHSFIHGGQRRGASGSESELLSQTHCPVLLFRSAAAAFRWTEACVKMQPQSFEAALRISEVEVRCFEPYLNCTTAVLELHSDVSEHS